MKIIAQGSESKVYSGDWLGMKVVIKQRQCKRYRHSDLDDRITKERMKGEVEILRKCIMAGISVPTLIDVNFITREIVSEEILNSISLRKFLETDCTNFNLASKIGFQLGALHSNHIIHGDLTTSNMLIQPSDMTIFLIDFGLGCISESDEDKAVDLYVMERAILGTYSACENFLKTIWNAYTQHCNKLNLVLARLEEVRARGRKRECFG